MSKTETNSSQNSISAKIKQLDSAVEWFYGDDFSLDDALAKYKSASELADIIARDLDNLKNQVQVLADFTKS